VKIEPGKKRDTCNTDIQGTQRQKAVSQKGSSGKKGEIVSDNKSEIRNIGKTERDTGTFGREEALPKGETEKAILKIQRNEGSGRVCGVTRI